jgi:putative chitobiose transport system permease protein
MQSSSKKKIRRIVVAYSFLFPALLVIGTFQLYPMINALILSFWDYFPTSETNHFIGLANFEKLLYDGAFWSSLWNSILYLTCVPIIIGLSIALAALVEPTLPGIGFFRACYYVPVVTMMVVVAFTWRLIFNDSGILNQFLEFIGFTQLLVNLNILEADNGYAYIPWLTSTKMAFWTIMTVTVWRGLGYYMVLFIVGLKSIPHELMEAARIDGASGWQRFLFIKIPMLWPTITLASILSSIAALQVFEEIYMMTNGKLGTQTLVFQIYERGFRVGEGGGLDLGYACAMGMVLFIVLFIFTTISVRSMDRVYKTD